MFFLFNNKDDTEKKKSLLKALAFLSLLQKSFLRSKQSLPVASWEEWVASEQRYCSFLPLGTALGAVRACRWPEQTRPVPRCAPA